MSDTSTVPIALRCTPAAEARPRKSLLILLITVTLLAALTAGVASGNTRYYRWTDERGNLVVSDRPPTDNSIAYEEVSTQGSGLRRIQPKASQEAPTAGNQAPARSPSVESSPPASETKVIQDPDICAAARNNLHTLETFARIRVRGADGELHYLSEEEKAAQREDAQALIRLHCPPQ